MKKLSEVCRIAGVTRRTLQEYDKIGLLEHTAETESGYWLYDDASLAKLYLILIFVEAGYKRRKIKEILSRPQDLGEELQSVVEALKLKRDRIDGLIKTIDFLKLELDESSKMTEEMRKIVGGIEFSRMYQNRSIKDSFDRAISFSTHIPEDMTVDDMKPYFRVVDMLTTIAYLSDKGAESDEVQICIEKLCEVFLELVRKTEGEDALHGLSGKELLIGTCEGLEELLMDSSMSELKDICGEGSLEFVHKAVAAYKQKLIEGKEE